MPDVIRSDSQRSDGSNRPRVSFNRDVHVKRIVPNETSRVTGTFTGNGSGQLIPSPVRKARLPKSKQQLAEEAARVLEEVDRVNCVVKNRGSNPEKFYTLPTRRKHKNLLGSPHLSLDRKSKRRNSEELVSRVDSPPKKPPRTFTHYPKVEKNRTSILNVFKKDKDSEVTPKKSNLRRSVSDATNSQSKSYNLDNAYHKKTRNQAETENNVKNSKKQLSPIIEDTQVNNYFCNNKENIDINKQRENVEDRSLSKTENRKSNVTEQLKEYIDEVDTALFNETGIRVHQPNHKKVPEIIIIDVDKAEKISRKKDKSKLSATNIGKKIKFLGNKPKKQQINEKNNAPKVQKPTVIKPQSPIVKKAIENLQKKENKFPNMIHSSQKPADKLPLTRGLTVDTMIKRLNNDKGAQSPPKTNIMITPTVSVQHNNNQPFSYTRGHSPERNYRSPDGSKSPEEPGSPIIYAHVVCDKSGHNNSTPIKQTVHTAYTNGKKHMPHSDSDEGLGNEEGLGFGKTVTHFGDDYLNGNRYHYDEDYSISPKLINEGYNYNEYNKTEHSIFIDSSSRGRGDGMDSKRRESLTEPVEMNFNSLKCNINTSRTDLSARRDLLESRINRRLEEKTFRQSPPSNGNSYANKYFSETKYYRQGSTSPVGYTEIYTTETKNDRNGKTRTTETRSRKDLSDKDRGYVRHKYDNEPKSLDSQISDYRSSPENITRRNDRYSHSNKYQSKDAKQKLYKDRGHYRSNPEIIQNNHDNYEDIETYHNSLKREKHESTHANCQERKYFERSEFDRKDRLGDSGIENDFKRESTEKYRSSKNRRDYCYDSEDEGFASSLLIASERQHTEDNINNRKIKNDYESDKGHRDDPYRNVENMEYKVLKEYKHKDKHEYAPRERSIDDGSHYDPRIDKDFETERNTLKKKVDRKPPKPEKKSGLEKVKQLFSRDSSKKKKEKTRVMVPEENLRARYTEYTGSREHLEPKDVRKHVAEVKSSYDYSNRRRLSTPSPSPTRDVRRNAKSETTHGSWFKSLDRLSRKKSKKEETGAAEEESVPKPAPAKNLRFFGDTDIESNDSLRHKQSKSRTSLTNSNYTDRTKSYSNRDLHTASDELKYNHKSETDGKNSRLSVKPPMSPNHRPSRDNHSGKDDRSRRKRNEVSSVESSTEGDGSQQSQRSVVYLHAATVGDIPGPGYLRNGRRAASREELVSNGSSGIRPQVKTLSRSFSVLAPWKPRYIKESYDIDYTQYPKPTKNGKYEQKVNRNGNSRKDSSSTLKKKANETKRTNQSLSTLNRSSRSKENLSSYAIKKSQDDLSKSSTLFRKKDRQSKENIRYAKDKDDKRMSNKSVSVESLGTDRRHKNEGRDVSRSVSMPRDPDKSAGWFNMNKKNKKALSTQRL